MHAARRRPRRARRRARARTRRGGMRGLRPAHPVAADRALPETAGAARRGRFLKAVTLCARRCNPMCSRL
eukprot:scaffold12160_cov60-Phaeocystis_antarctica.AAC.5